MNQDFKSAEKVHLKKYIINFSVFLIIAITVYFVMAAIAQSQLYSTATSDNIITIRNEDLKSGDIDFNYSIKSKNDNIKTTYTADILRSDIEKLNDDFVTIFLPSMQCEAFIIYINEKIIAVEGDITKYNSNVWTKNYSYTIDSTLFDKDISKLKVVQFSRYLRGGLANPFIIDGYASSLSIKDYKAFDIRHGIFGISIFLLLLIILMLFLFKEKRSKYYLLLVSLIFMMIGYSEYFELSYLPFDFLLFKKITVSSNFIVAGLGTVVYRHLYNKNKYNILFMTIYSAIILIPAFLVKDMVTYKAIYTILTYLIIPLILYWVYSSIINLKKYTNAKTLLTLAVSSVLYIIVWIISELAENIYMDTVTVVIMPSFMIVALTLIFIDLHELQVNIAETHKKTIIDGLTKLYNAEFMANIIKDMDPPIAFTVLDLDDFKNINDSYGHIAGDGALKLMANIVSELLRDGDIFGRYGGDEFILILNQHSTESVKNILERIRKKVESTPLTYQESKIYMTISLGYYITYDKEDFTSMLEKADTALYQAKNKGKNTIVEYVPQS